MALTNMGFAEVFPRSRATAFAGRALMLLLLSACGGHSISDPARDVSLTYEDLARGYELAEANFFQSIGQGIHPLPQTVHTYEDRRIEITEGSLVLRMDRSYTEIRTYHTVFNSGAPATTNTVAETGTWDYDPRRLIGEIQFTPADGTRASGASYVNGHIFWYRAECELLYK